MESGSFAYWTPEQWVVVITGSLSALGAFIVAIIRAWKGEQHTAMLKERIARVEQKVDEHEVRATVRA